MNKILKILSILIVGFVMFSCSTPTNDPTPYIPEPSGSETPVETPTDDTEPSGPETPVETPSDDPVEETPEEPTYSITFIAYTEEDTATEAVKTFLNSLPDYKNLEEGTEIELPTTVYLTEDSKLTLNKTSEYLKVIYEGNVTLVKVENENIIMKFRI